MELILWRHAEAADGTPDLARRLTSKGTKEAGRMAEWLRARLPKNVRVLSSPAERAKQTAAALTGDFEVSREIAPGAQFAAVLAASGWPEAGGTVLLVGHQPAFGEVAAFLLGGEAQPWSIRKGGLVWLKRRTRDGGVEVILKAALSPELL